VGVIQGRVVLGREWLEKMGSQMGEGVGGFLDHLNSVHQNVQFTKEMNRDNHLPFLDIDYG
jgi:Sec-independent protein translocase protein TatA